MRSIIERIQRAFSKDRIEMEPVMEVEPEIEVEVVSQPQISLAPRRSAIVYSDKNVYEISTPHVPCINTLYNEALKSLGL